MPADKYGKSLYKAGTMKSEKAAIANRDPARKKAAEKIMKREGTTSKAGGRAAAGAGAGLGAVAASEAARLLLARHLARSQTANCKCLKRRHLNAKHRVLARSQTANCKCLKRRHQKLNPCQKLNLRQRLECRNLYKSFVPLLRTNQRQQRRSKMPLVKSPSKAAFRKNIKAEVNAGKPVKQAVAIAYSVKRESAKKGKK
jgi:hypothetical protein